MKIDFTVLVALTALLIAIRADNPEMSFLIVTSTYLIISFMALLFAYLFNRHEN